MPDMMTFPDTVEEYMEQYKIVDTEQIYTNGTEMVPIFRMKQWFEHVSAQPERKKGKWIRTRTMRHDGELYCDQCEQEHPEQKIIWNYCPNCGCEMRQEGEDHETDRR